MAYNLISLFTGAGGLDLGFRTVGYHELMASDIMPQARQTYLYNNPATPYLLEDIRQLTIDDIRAVIGDIRVDVIIGGPPCQGFSNMGNKNSADPRNYLFESYVRIVNSLRPSVFLFENVKGLCTMFEGRFLRNVIDRFLAIGYNINYSIIDSSIYGVPQKRERVIIVGTLSDRPFLFPLPNKQPIGSLLAYRNVGEAINDLADKGMEVPNHIPLVHSEKVLRRYQLIPEGGKLPAPELLPEDIRRKNFGITYTRLDRNALSPTVVPGNNALPIHPFLNRSLTPREAARLQSFPDSYVFFGDRRSQCIQVGNAVPPLMAAKLAVSVEKYISGEEYEGMKPDFSVTISERQKVESNLRHPRNKRATLRFADLFCGAGGFTQGLENAGLECVLGVDFNKYAVAAYKKNFSHECIQMDLSDEDNQHAIAKKIKDSGARLIVGGPPCQGFSIFGKRRFVNTKQHDLTRDERNNLVYAFANIVVESGVEWFIMENVPGIVSAHHGSYVESIVDFFHKHGYRTEHKIINAADYGVPQLRRRFILIGTTTNYVIPFPKPKFFENPDTWQHSYRTVAEVLSDLADDKTLGKLKNHVAPGHRPAIVERFTYIKEGQKLNIDNLPEHLKIGTKTGRPIVNFSHIYERLDRNRPAPTVVPGHNAFPVHPFLNRTLTVREAARLQTFPDSFEFVGPLINQCLQVGNAFPCLVAQTFGERLRTVINRDWKEGETSDLAFYSMFEKK